ncbi:hypothetical protein Y1Q_0010281 [Alligator mississippiensis]|uniref:Reverse transcriptase domain-containing protein n=1 Tax=Alligator mississippiensis TaxID=8496 RepID=A0A151P1K5_ALLMI|nr:hypothetical protein Y1Q_0010281 [Alligator mississippiensis]
MRQGCLLNPIIFNLAMELLLQAVAGRPGGLNLYSQKLSILDYADDLILLTPDATQLQQMLNVTSEAARFNSQFAESKSSPGCWRTLPHSLLGVGNSGFGIQPDDVIAPALHISSSQ